MAKHIKGKAVSKGLRRSSIKAGGSKAPAIIAQAERVATAMRDAFLNMQVRIFDTGTANGLAAHQKQAKVVDAVLTCAKQNSGNNKVGRGWTANLSPRTVRQLTEQGVFA